MRCLRFRFGLWHSSVRFHGLPVLGNETYPVAACKALITIHPSTALMPSQATAADHCLEGMRWVAKAWDRVRNPLLQRSAFQHRTRCQRKLLQTATGRALASAVVAEWDCSRRHVHVAPHVADLQLDAPSRNSGVAALTSSLLMMRKTREGSCFADSQ